MKMICNYCHEVYDEKDLIDTPFGNCCKQCNEKILNRVNKPVNKK